MIVKVAEHVGISGLIRLLKVSIVAMVITIVVGFVNVSLFMR